MQAQVLTHNLFSGGEAIVKTMIFLEFSEENVSYTLLQDTVT